MTGTAASYTVGTTGTGWFGTVRPRIGYAFDHLLVFATGGFAYGNFGTPTATYYPGNGAAGVPYTATGNNPTQTGYAIGGGAEYAFARNWALKAEYLHVDLSNGGRTLVNATMPGKTISTGAHDTAEVGRVGVNFKF
jgi:outer membrane immunogenic protein